MSYEGDKYTTYIVKHGDKVFQRIREWINNKYYCVIEEKELVIALDYEILLDLIRKEIIKVKDLELLSEIANNPCRCVELLNNSSKVVKIELTITNEYLKNQLNKYSKKLFRKIVNRAYEIIKNNIPEKDLNKLYDWYNTTLKDCNITIDNIILLLCNVNYKQNSDRVYIIANTKQKDKIDIVIDYYNK